MIILFYNLATKYNIILFSFYHILYLIYFLNIGIFYFFKYYYINLIH